MRASGARDPQRVWAALESIPDLGAVEAEWRAHLAVEFQSFSSLLRSSGSLAKSHPCLASDPCGCQHAVVRHGHSDFEGVCCCDPVQCDPQPLTRVELSIRSVDARVLGAAVGAALGLKAAHEVVTGLHQTWRIGVYSPIAGRRFPVYLTAQAESDDLRVVAESLAARAGDPLILVAPTRDLFDSECEAMLKGGRGHFVALSEDFHLDERGTVTSRRPVTEIMQPLLDLALPPAKAASGPQFPTPWDATWPEVNIRFRDGHSVSVRVREAHGVFTYTQMGMANARNGAPNKQWLLLRAFADRHGALDWSSRSAHRSNQKQKDTLAQRLRTFFGIEGDPFELTRASGGRGKGWKTRFALDP